MNACLRVLDVEECGDYFSVMTNSIEIRIWFLTDEIIRIRAGFDGDFNEEFSQLDERIRRYCQCDEPADAILTDMKDNAVIDGPKLKVIIRKRPFRICVYDYRGTVLHADVNNLAFQEDCGYRRVHTSEVLPGDYFYRYDEKCVPFYIKLNQSTRKAVGYYYPNTAEYGFDAGWEGGSVRERNTRFWADCGDIDLFLITGPQLGTVVERYHDLTGMNLPQYETILL